MLLRIYSILMLGTLIALSVYFVWLLQLPTQPDFVYDVSDMRFVLIGYIDFVFLTITTLTIILIIGRSSFQEALERGNTSPFDRMLFRVMFKLPLVVICCQCAVILLAVFAASISTGSFYF